MATNEHKTKTYSNDEMTVFWKPDTCIHAKKCWKGLIQVFDPRNRPWINMEGATTQRIKKQIDECPSGALSYVMKGDEVIQSQVTEIKCMENGPLLVSGELKLTKTDGTTETRSKTTAFCRCGASMNKPFCDGKHQEINFIG